jgi:integrase
VTGTTTDARPRPQPGRRTRLAAGGAPPRTGPANGMPAEEVFSLVCRLPMVAGLPSRRKSSRVWGVPVILAWLQRHPGEGWQERWLAAGADQGTGWLDEVCAADPRSPATKRGAMTYAVAYLVLARVILPGYEFMSAYRSRYLFKWVREQRRPDLFARLEQAGAELGMQPPQLRDALNAITRIVMHTGRDIDQLAGDDVHEHREWFYQGQRGADRGLNAAWDLLALIGVFPAGTTLHGSARLGQRSVEELVDYQQVQCRPVRDVLVRYLSERAPALDHSSLRALVPNLAGLFWADIERHHPGISTLRLPPEVAEAWKQRLRTWTARDGTVRPRKDYLVILSQVRTLYLDIQEWAMEDPSWAWWAAPSPVRRSELAGMSKARRKTVSEVHQRVRERLPHLQRLAGSAGEHRTAQARLLAAAGDVPIGQELTHDGVTYRRTLHKSYLKDPSLPCLNHVIVKNTATGEMANLTEAEDDAFWTWAVIETLRHTGVRIEELLEITQLAIVSYRLPATGEAVPLLQILPSKGNEERLLLVSPELASVLASVVKRLRDDGNGSIRLVARYDQHEKVTGPPLPHLFQRKNGWRPSVISPTLVTRMLNDALTRAGITDATGQPLRYTAHDFRRMFATEAVTGGLPVHIAAKVLGHRNIATTETYLAVFQDELISAYRAFLGKRRALRPEAEYREPTGEEWREFEEHFEKRKLSLGACGRPYGTPCQHEHACIRCPMLRPDPAARGRLAEIIANLADRIAEARINGWTGEAEGLKVSLASARAKLAALDRTARNMAAGTADLGMPAPRVPGSQKTP